MKCYTFEGKKRTQEELYNSILDLLKNSEDSSVKYLIFNVQDDVINFIETAHKGFNSPNSIGVSNFLDLEHTLTYENGVSVNLRLTPMYDKEARILNSIKQILDSPEVGGNYDLARQIIEEQIKEEEGIADFGSLMHELFSTAIKARISTGQGVDSQEFKIALEKVKNTIQTSVDYTDKEGIHHPALMQVLTGKILGAITIDDIMKIITDTVTSVENKVFYGRSPETKYFSEYEVATKDLIGAITDLNGNPVNNLRGIIDLLIVNPDGTVEVIDFKVASRNYNDWYAAKQYHTDYQLGTYRSILAANGLDGRKVVLKTFPIHFPLGKINQMKAEDIQNRTLAGVKSISHLDWDYGKFTKNLRCLIRTKIVPLSIDNNTLKTDIQTDIENMLGRYEIPGKDMNSITKEEIASGIWVSEFNGKPKYHLYDRSTGEKITKNSKEDFTKPGGEIDQMINRMQKFYSKQVESLVNDIKKYQDPNNTSTSRDLLGSSKNTNTKLYNVLEGVFGKYCNPSWQLIEFPDLLDYGIFLFLNQAGMFEVVRVTDKNLRTELNISGNNTVLGKFLSNNKAQLLTLISPLQANVANVELIETVIALNKISSNLQNGRLSAINIINPLLGQRELPDITTLLENFKYLTDHTQTQNDFKSGKIQVASTWEVMLNSIQEIVSNATMDPDLHLCVTGLEMDLPTIDKKIELIISMMNKLEARYSQVRKNNFLENWSFDTPQEKVYLILSQALLYYRETPVLFDGKLSKWGLHFEEVIRILGTPFMSQYKGTLNNGFKAIGLGQGLDMGTPTASASGNLSALYQFWDSSFLHIRKHTLDQATYLNKITVDYFKRHNVSNVSRAILNSSSVWEQFIEKGQDGKFTKELQIVNPETLNSTEDKLFLNQLLWEINKYLLPGITEELQQWRYETHKNLINNLLAVDEAKSSGKYYHLPLRRSTNFDRLRHIRDNGSIVSLLKKYWQSLSDEYDPRLLHVSAREAVSKEFGESTQMYNQYKLSDTARASIIEKEGIYDFELDLNLLALDVSFQSKRKELFDDALTHASAMAVVFHYLNQTSDLNFDEQLENLEDESKIILKNQTIISKELQDVSKGIGAMKRLNSFIVLGIRPLQFIKEITFGQFTNYSRAWALKGTGVQVSAKNIFDANKLVWGKLIAGWLKSSIKDEDLASFTMILLVNKLYGIANEDLNQIVKSNSLSRTGLKNGLSKYMFVFNSAPDFFNRMTLFIAKMLQDGSFDAHYVDENGILQYDIKKDKRFEKLVKLGINSTSNDKEYLELKSLYRAMINLFIKEGFTDNEGKLLNPDSENLYLPRAYTVKEKLALKEVSDLAYGYYDHEAKSLNDHKFFGLVFKQFMAFWTAKTTLWLRAPGANTALGSWVPLMEDGKQVYRRVYEDVNGKLQVELTTENPNGDLEPVKVWQGDYVEGLIYSIGFTLRDIFTGKWSDIAGNKQRLGNLKLALHDILVGLILYNILRLIFTGGTGKTRDANPAERTLLRAMLDTSPAAIFGLSITPSFVSTFENLKNDIPNLFSEDGNVQDFLRKRFGAIKDISWEQH